MKIKKLHENFQKIVNKRNKLISKKREITASQSKERLNTVKKRASILSDAADKVLKLRQVTIHRTTTITKRVTYVTLENNERGENISTNSHTKEVSTVKIGDQATYDLYSKVSNIHNNDCEEMIKIAEAFQKHLAIQANAVKSIKALNIAIKTVDEFIEGNYELNDILKNFKPSCYFSNTNNEELNNEDKYLIREYAKRAYELKAEINKLNGNLTEENIKYELASKELKTAIFTKYISNKSQESLPNKALRLLFNKNKTATKLLNKTEIRTLYNGIIALFSSLSFGGSISYLLFNVLGYAAKLCLENAKPLMTDVASDTLNSLVSNYYISLALAVIALSTWLLVYLGRQSEDEELLKYISENFGDN